jgi:hypothetical protein
MAGPVSHASWAAGVRESPLSSVLDPLNRVVKAQMVAGRLQHSAPRSHYDTRLSNPRSEEVGATNSVGQFALAAATSLVSRTESNRRSKGGSIDRSASEGWVVAKSLPNRDGFCLLIPEPLWRCGFESSPALDRPADRSEVAFHTHRLGDS